MPNGTGARVLAVGSSPAHTFSKRVQSAIRLIEGLGVEGDAHAGVNVKHRSRVPKNPVDPNLRQVHLIQSEILDGLNKRGFDLAAGAIGENILTQGIDLHQLPRGARFCVGQAAVIVVEGLRNPCWQLNAYRDGLMDAVLYSDSRGTLVRKAGVMGTVHVGGRSNRMTPSV